MVLSKVKLNVDSENENSIVKIMKLNDKIRDLFSRHTV
jgi:hypothetical protein